MLEFICSRCGMRAPGDGSLRGKHVQCPHCQATEIAPGSRSSCESPASAVATPEDAELLAPRRREYRDGLPPLADGALPSIRKDLPHILWRYGKGVVVVVVVVTAVVLLMPATERVHVASARTQSTCNLKQIALASQGFHDAHKRLPFNGADVDDGKAVYTTLAVARTPSSGSWAFQILPFIDEDLRYAGGPNGDRLKSGIAAYMNPVRGRPAFALGKGQTSGPWCDYFINIYLNTGATGTDAWARPDIRRSMNDITDGTSLTVFAGDGTIATGLYGNETVFPGADTIWIGGTEGTARGGSNTVLPGVGPNVKLQRDPDGRTQPPSPISWGGPYPPGALMGMVDGTVRLFPYSMSGTTFGAFLTPNNGEDVDPPDT